MKNITIKQLAMIVVIFLLYFTSAIHSSGNDMTKHFGNMFKMSNDAREKIELEREWRQKKIDFENDLVTELTAHEIEILKKKNAVVLRDIVWESTCCPENQKIQISQNYTLHITDTTKFFPIKDLEKKINQLYKYTKFLKHTGIKIPEKDTDELYTTVGYREKSQKEYWYLKISGERCVEPLLPLGTTVLNCSTYLEPVILYIPISGKLLTKGGCWGFPNPQMDDLNNVFNFGKFADVPGPYPSHWDELTREHLSLIKLFLFSQGSMPKVDLYNDKLLHLQVLETLQTQLLKTTTECNLCPYGHSNHKVRREVEGFRCNICKIHCGGCFYWKRLRCTDCHTVRQNMCEPFFSTKSKFGPNTKKELKNYLQKQNGKKYTELEETHILSEFLTHIEQMNWKIYLLNKTSMGETPDTSMKSTHAKILNLGTPEDLKYCGEDTKSLWRRLSVDYHKFWMYNDYNLSNDWTYQLDISQIEKTIIDFIGLQWDCIETIPAGVRQTKTQTVGYTNETTVSTTTKDSKNYSWSVKTDVPHFGELSYEKRCAAIEDKINSVVTNYTEETIYQKEIDSSDVERSIYILTFIGEIRSSGDTIVVRNPKKIKMIDSSDPAPLVDYEKEFMMM